MKIAIHDCKGSFSDRWIEYCKENSVPYKIVDCYASDIIEQLKDCSALMWHHAQGYYKDVLFAKQLLFSLEQAGIKVFPDFNTGWHFDDKVGQKYLLEAIGAPFVPTYVFYDSVTANMWAENTKYPKVFKLRGGAGSANVSLVKTISESRKKINKAFNRGFLQFNRVEHLKERYNKYKIGKDTLLGVLKGIRRLFVLPEQTKMMGKEKGYAYFQEFIPGNNNDTRVIVIGKRAFAITRGVRKGDFRASGSGLINYKKEDVNIECIKISFEVNKHIQAQCIGFDYVFQNGKALILELSYGFVVEPYDFCPGYWDEALQWHEGKFNPQRWMVEDLLEEIQIKGTR